VLSGHNRSESNGKLLIVYCQEIMRVIKKEHSKSEKLRMGTWNIKNLNEGKLLTVCNEMTRTRADILGISQHRWEGQGHCKFQTEHTNIYSD
jgi:hypothetical protein